MQALVSLAMMTNNPVCFKCLCLIWRTEFLHIFPYFVVIIEPNSDETWCLYYFVTEVNFVFKIWLKSHGEQPVKAAYMIGAAIFCGLKKLHTEILLDNHYTLYRHSSWPEGFAEQINETSKIRWIWKDYCKWDGGMWIVGGSCMRGRYSYILEIAARSSRFQWKY